LVVTHQTAFCKDSIWLFATFPAWFLQWQKAAVAAGTCAYFFIMQKLSGVAPDGRILMVTNMML
jgi:hypothetical protein